MTLALALVLEGLSDMTAMVIQGKQGLVPTTIFQGERKMVQGAGFVAILANSPRVRSLPLSPSPTLVLPAVGERKWEMAGWMMGSQLFAVGAVLWTFMARPVWYRCRSVHVPIGSQLSPPPKKEHAHPPAQLPTQTKFNRHTPQIPARTSCSNMCSCESYVLKNQLWSMFCGVGEYECDALGADVC